MKLLIVAGGGGHFAPALAIIEKLPESVEVLLVGRKYSLEGDSALSFEYQTAKNLGIPVEALTTGRFQRKFTKHTIKSLFKTPLGLAQAFSILNKFKPDVVLSFGGYVSVPVVLAAKAMNVPIVVHEQILGAGSSNKLAARFAKKVCISWEESRKFFPEEKVVLTGNPVRKWQMENGKWKMAKNDLSIIYITGGSAGAHAVNLLIEGCIEDLLKNYNVIHQTGDAREFGDFERLQKLKESLEPRLQKRLEIRKFIEPAIVFDILQKADLVVSRSGINTVTELLYFGKPALLVPLPYGQKNEQLQNALFIKDVGLAEVLEQHSLTAEKLYLKILWMFDNIDKYKKNAEKGRSLIDTNAAEKIIEVVKNARDKKEN